VATAVERLRAARIRTSLFITPECAAIDAAAEMGVDAVELHTGEYAERFRDRHTRDGAAAVQHALEQIARAAAYADERTLGVHAGHGLTYENVGAVAAIAPIAELNIGHSVISRAVFTGIERAVREMKELVLAARAAPSAGEG
jgi:pyridoxine 5-phosphate synthase